MMSAVINRFASRTSASMFSRGRSSWWLAAVLFLVGLVIWSDVLVAVRQPAPQQRKQTILLRPEEEGVLSQLSNHLKQQQWLREPDARPGKDATALQTEVEQQQHSSENEVESFPPPLYGYDSVEEMDGRVDRFPTVQERVQVYMSNWYLPPCQQTDSAVSNDEDDGGFIHYRYVDQDNSTGEPSGFHGKLVVREVDSDTEFTRTIRTFELDGNTTLGKLHYMVHDMMLPENCDSEYCVDTVRHWYPAENRVGLRNGTTDTAVPVLFQFSDEELSKAWRPATDKNEPYPGLPHLKKSRLSLLPQDIVPDRKCTAVPKPILPTVTDTDGVPEHLQPIIYKLKTNRHYGMIGRIPPQDIPWSEKKNQAIFRGTLTGLLPPDSRFSLSTRNSHAATLSDEDAEEKCLQLDRCRLVYSTNQYYEGQKRRSAKQGRKMQEPLVDAKLVLPMLQHTDMPESFNGVSLFGDRMNKQGLLKYKAIIMLEGNDAGTGFKWALFSQSVVMTAARPKFTSWAMEELLEPWLHYIPLDPDNFEQDVHDKMQWVLDHDKEAKAIAHRGSLWIRDLLLHPNAALDDEAISDEMVRRYAAHFVYDESLDPVGNVKDDYAEDDESTEP